MRAKHEHAKCENTAHAADTQNQTDDVFSVDSDPSPSQCPSFDREYIK